MRTTKFIELVQSTLNGHRALRSFVWTLSTVVALSASGCGSNSSGGGGGAPGGIGSATNGATIISTPQGNALSYQFTATAVQPSGPLTGEQTRRFLAGVFPFGQASVGGSCGGSYNYGTEYLSFCNARSMQPLMRNAYYNQQVFGNGAGFGSIVPSVASWFNTSGMTGVNMTRKFIQGYEFDGMSNITLGMTQQVGVPCPANYQQIGFNSPTSCTQVIISGVLTLSPQFIQENLASAAISRIALDINMAALSGTAFIIHPNVGGGSIAVF